MKVKIEGSKVVLTHGALTLRLDSIEVAELVRDLSEAQAVLLRAEEDRWLAMLAKSSKNERPDTEPRLESVKSRTKTVLGVKVPPRP